MFVSNLPFGLVQDFVFVAFFSHFSCCVIACISMFLNSQDQMHHHCILCTHQHCIPCTPELISTKEQNARLLEEIRKHKVERDSYILERDLQYEQMRKELEIQMEVYKGKVIELQIENYLVKADLELMTNKGDEQEDKLKEKNIINEDDNGKRMAPGLQTQKELERKTRSQVLKAFDWKLDSADPVLLRAACAFWDSFSDRDVGNGGWRKKARVSKLDRMVAWKAITLNGWNGEMHKEIDSEFMRRKRFCAIKMVQASDMESKFNVKVSTDIGHCDPSRKKYARGLLPSDRTCRRVQQRVYNAAEQMGYVSFPPEHEGNIWCWGDEHEGNFRKGVNRYVNEVYFKTAMNDSVTASNPWIIPLTGDLARVSLRGKGITMCGAKEADPRLPSQVLTGKTMNQSRNLYTPAVAGYTDEKKLMPFFEEMVAAFMEIEKRGYIEIDGERRHVNIKVVIVADMSFLHKYLNRGGGSATTTRFCFMCSSTCHYRHRGYPGGCLKCRAKNMVYDKATGCQLCLHHDVCIPEFLEMETARFDDLTARVSTQIPLSKLPCWESVAALRGECNKRCLTEAERAIVKKKTTEAQLQRWLLTRIKRKFVHTFCVHIFRDFMSCAIPFL
jgi:hypothetical protein